MPRSKTKKTKPASGKAPNPTFEFLMAYMKSKPKAVYADAAEAAKSVGHTIYPIMWGRAQSLLGRIKAKPRGAGKTAKAAAAPPKAAAPRPRTASASMNGTSIAIDGSDVERWSRVIEQLNGGGRATLVFDGSGWAVTVR